MKERERAREKREKTRKKRHERRTKILKKDALCSGGGV